MKRDGCARRKLDTFGECVNSHAREIIAGQPLIDWSADSGRWFGSVGRFKEAGLLPPSGRRELNPEDSIEVGLGTWETHRCHCEVNGIVLVGNAIAWGLTPKH